jgi:hypothetical protein
MTDSSQSIAAGATFKASYGSFSAMGDIKAAMNEKKIQCEVTVGIFLLRGWQWQRWRHVFLTLDINLSYATSTTSLLNCSKQRSSSRTS